MITITIASFLVQALLQSSSPAQPPASPVQIPLTLAGCAAADTLTPDQFRLFDPHRGVMYRLSEEKFGMYTGRHVPIVGGLLPTPNIAAQAGSIDPTVTTMALTTMNLSRVTPLNRLKRHVEQVRTVPGGCPSDNGR